MKKFDEIKPSADQEKCINYSSGDLLVNGLPGAGKSVVLLKRALKYYKNSSPESKNEVFLTTYNNTLVMYTREVFRQVGIDETRMRIGTLDSYCSHVYSVLFGYFDSVSDSDREKYVMRALQNHFSISGTKHRFYDVNPQFWAEEFLWIKQKNIQSLQQYQEAERIGRGSSVRITREERKLVYELFTEYCEEMKRNGKIDREDIYIRLLNSDIDFTPHQFRYVLVDEAQDFYYAKLKVAKLLARESITIAADKAQKIYSTGFTWKELGIDVRGNASKTLNKTFRSTKQIVQLAESLAEINRALEKDKSEYTVPMLPTVIGEDYPYIISCPNDAAEKEFLKKLVNKRLKEKLTIGILYRTYKEFNEVKQLLDQNRIKFERVEKDTKWSLMEPGVKLSTLHSAKGLEFDIVIIPFFNSMQYPLESTMEGADESQIEELKIKERNLLYVAMTRARSMLYLLYSGSVSPFLSEFNPDYYNYCTSGKDLLPKPERCVCFVDAESTRSVVQKDDTIITHIEGEEKERILYGSKVLDPDTWVFIGKRVNEAVKIGAHIYVIDEIVDEENSSKIKIKRPASTNSWEAVLSQIKGVEQMYALHLSAYGIPFASTVNSELMGFAGDIIAEAVLAWEEYKVVLLSDEQICYKNVWEERGWNVITVNMDVPFEYFV